MNQSSTRVPVLYRSTRQDNPLQFAIWLEAFVDSIHPLFLLNRWTYGDTEFGPNMVPSKNDVKKLTSHLVDTVLDMSSDKESSFVSSGHISIACFDFSPDRIVASVEP
jgi:hypothetical protein